MILDQEMRRAYSTMPQAHTGHWLHNIHNKTADYVNGNFVNHPLERYCDKV